MVHLRGKCLIIGDSCVGKSALTQYFHSDGAHFPKSYTMTVGVEYLVKPVNIPDTQDVVEMHLYDTAGQDVFNELVTKFWDTPSMVMVVFDITDAESFKNCSAWLERCKPFVGKRVIPAVLVGNKTDLEARRAVDQAEARNFAAQNGFQYFECSAKEGSDCESPFYFLAGAFHSHYREELQVMAAAV